MLIANCQLGWQTPDIGRPGEWQRISRQLRIANYACSMTFDTEQPGDPVIPDLSFHQSQQSSWMPFRREPGEVILDRYEVLAELGQGGMGVVYKCLDRIAGVAVALKELPPELAHNPLEMREIRKNFQLVANLSHPNIASYKHLEQDSRRQEYFLIMEYVQGNGLKTWIQSHENESIERRLRAALPILRQVAEALAFAHGERIIHRDIKPDNVMLDTRNRVKLLDFGLAAQVQDSLSRMSLSRRQTDAGTGQISGTPLYMSPEQWNGYQENEQTDQYALAVLAYEMIAGRVPFASRNMEILRSAVLGSEPQRIDVLTTSQWEALRRGLAKKPQERFPGCREFLDALSFEGEKQPKTSQPASNTAPPKMSTAEEKNSRRQTEVLREEVIEFNFLLKRRNFRSWLSLLIRPYLLIAWKFQDIMDHFKTPRFLDLVRIHAGSFLMGSPMTEVGRSSMEMQHRVTITKGFWMGKYLVTQEQWEAVMGRNPSCFQKGGDYPVEQVSWEDAMEFCKKLNRCDAIPKFKGYHFDLPTEAQWEYACRAGTTGAYDGSLDWIAWYNANSDSSTHPVGKKKPNAWGLYDMHGNVEEWCRDWHGFYQGDATDPAGPPTGVLRVGRGGGWQSGMDRCRSAVRSNFSPENRLNSLGFRIALVPDE